MSRKIYLILIFLTCVLSAVDAKARKDEMKMLHVQSRTSSIAGKRIFKVVQDSEGYLWFGTDNGLFRYNGSIFRPWRFNSTDDISSDFVMALCIDSSGRLWVGTDTGINLIEDNRVVRRAPLTQDMVFDIKDFSDSLLLCSGGADGEGRNGLYLYDKRSGEKKYVLEGQEFANAVDLGIFGDYIWVPTSNGSGRTYVLDRRFNICEIIDGGRFDFSMSCYGNTVYTWGKNGVRVFSTDGRRLELPPFLSQASGKEILFITPDTYKDRLIVGIKDEGFFSIDFSGNDVKRLWESEKLTVNSVYRFFAGRGVYCLSENLNGYKILFEENTSSLCHLPDSNIGELMQGVYPSPVDGNVFVTTTMGVYLLNVYSRSFENIAPPEIKVGRQIVSSFIDSHYSLYVLSMDGHIEEYDWDGDGFSFRRSVEYSGGKLYFFENYSGEICSAVGDKLYNWTTDPQGQKPSTLDWPVGPRAAEGADGNIYLYGSGGVFELRKDNSFYKIPVEIENPTCMYADLDGNLWIGSLDRGLFRYSRSDGSLKHYTESSGLPEMTVRNILEDRWHNIWLSTRHYFVRISVKEMQMSVFDLSTDYTLSYAPACSMAVGDEWRGERILIATLSQQLAVIDPMKESTEGPIPLSFDALFINGERAVLPDEGLTLSHDENQLLLMFSGLDYSPRNSGLNYSYKLDGLDNSWVFCGQNTSASYSGLHKGHYTFRVRVQGTDGVWRDSELALGITIRPSFWNSTFAYFLYLAFIAAFVAAIAIHFRRVSARKEETRRITAEKDMNERLYKERVGMLSNISHEFRTPLSLIYGPAKEIENAPDVGEKYRKLAALIDSNATWMKNLSDQIILFNSPSQVEAIKVTDTDISALVCGIADNFAYMAEGKEIWLESSVPSSVTAFCDRDKVSKILTNLIFNALKYTPKGGAVSVSMSSLTADNAVSLYPFLKDSAYKGKYLEVSVKDTGIGISKENVEKIFRRYERLREEVEGGNVPEGFGIGLNYALYLARLHKGDIRVTENSPNGSCFYFAFPCERKAWSDSEVFFDSGVSPAPALSSDNPSSSVENGVSVLIVEDNLQLRDYIESVISAEYTVYKTSNGQEAWEFMQSSVPDIVLSDVMMPYKDGVELCRDIKNDDRFCHIPVVLLTAKTGVESQVEGLSEGADAYLQKPFDPQLLKATLKSIVDNRKRLQRSLSETSSSSTVSQVTGSSLNSRDKAFLEKFYEAVENGYPDEKFNIADLSALLGMSYSSFYAKIKALLGQTPRDFLLSYRLDKAKELLKAGEYTVSEVAYKVGFSSLSSFSRSFKNKFGVPPSSAR